MELCSKDKLFELERPKCAKSACLRLNAILEETSSSNVRLCSSACIDSCEEMVTFDVGSKTTWFRYESELTGQLSMHPTLSPVRAFNDALVCPHCSSCRAHRVSHQQKCEAKACSTPTTARKAGMLATTFAKLALDKCKCISVASVFDEASEEYTTASPQPALHDCVLSSSEPQSADDNSTGSDDTMFTLVTFLFRHMLQRSRCLLQGHLPVVICKPFNCSEKLCKRIARFMFETVKVSGYCSFLKGLMSSFVFRISCISFQTLFRAETNRSESVCGIRNLSGHRQWRREHYCDANGQSASL